MKKFLSFAVCVIVCLSAMAANPNFGVKAGVGISHFWDRDYFDNGAKASYQIGLFMEYKFNNSNLSFAPELVLALQGSKYKNEIVIVDQSHEQDLTYNTNYINIPLIFKYNVIPRFSIDFGPQIGFNVYSKSTIEDFETFNMKDDTRFLDFGFGLGASLNVSPKVLLQVRYNLGLTEVFENEDTKNGNFQLAVGYRF